MLREFGDEQAVSSEERFQQIYILEENILHSISKLYVSVILSLDVFRLLLVALYIQRTKRRSHHASSSRFHEV